MNGVDKYVSDIRFLKESGYEWRETQEGFESELLPRGKAEALEKIVKETLKVPAALMPKAKRKWRVIVDPKDIEPAKTNFYNFIERSPIKEVEEEEEEESIKILNCSKLEAEKLLKGCPPGTYILRQSQSVSGAIVISMMTGEGYVDCLFELRNFGRQKRYVTGKPGEEIVFRSVAEIRDFAEDLKEEEEELFFNKDK